jgi:diguanylate cyclase
VRRPSLRTCIGRCPIRSRSGPPIGPTATARPPVQLLRAAEQALRAGKAAGGQRTSWATRAGDLDSAALHRAVRSGEFSVMYQPIVSIETGMVTALEALVRWEDPDRGVLLPERFLDRADELGLLAPIGTQLAGMAIDRLGEWQHEMGRPDLALHINLSVSQLARPSLTGVIAGQLRRAGVRASSLVAEISEPALARGGEVAHQSAALRSMGVRVALDRFGSGNLCMADLRRRPLDLVKIELGADHALGGMLQERTLVAVVRDVAEALGVQVVATGVEHDRQLLPAVGMGCDLAQGLLFAGPVGELDVPEVLQRPRFWWRTLPPAGAVGHR